MSGQFEGWSGRIIWSVDNMDLRSLIEILKRKDFPRDEVAVKLDRLFLMEHGLNAIGAVQSLGVPVFADAKIIEIPVKVMELTKLHLEQRPWMLNVMAQIANTGVSSGICEAKITSDDKLDVLCDFAEECKKVGTKPCVVTVLTSKQPSIVKYEYESEVNKVVHRYVLLAVSCGITEIICSPKEAAYLCRKGWTPDMRLSTPGVRLPDSSKDDQERVMSPGEALAKGADRLVIGRELSRNGDFFGNLEKIMEDIHQWENR